LIFLILSRINSSKAEVARSNRAGQAKHPTGRSELVKKPSLQAFIDSFVYL